MSQSIQKIYEKTLSSEQSFEENVFTFIEATSEGNINVIKFIVEQTNKIIDDKKIHPYPKFNALKLLAVCLETKNSNMVQLVQDSKILSKFETLALSQKKIKDPEKGKSIFSSKDLECIEDWAQFFPVDAKNKPSKFQQLYKKLLSEKFKFPQGEAISIRGSQSRQSLQSQSVQQLQKPIQTTQPPIQQNTQNQIPPPSSKPANQDQKDPQKPQNQQPKQSQEVEVQAVNSKLNQLQEGLKNLYQNVNSGDDMVELWQFLIEDISNSKVSVKQALDTHKDSIPKGLKSAVEETLEKTETIETMFNSLQNKKTQLSEFKDVVQLFLGPNNMANSVDANTPGITQTNKQQNQQSQVGQQSQAKQISQDQVNQKASEKQIQDVVNAINYLEESKQSMIEAAKSDSLEIEIWEFLFEDLKDRLSRLEGLINNKLPQNIQSKAQSSIDQYQALIKNYEFQKSQNNPGQAVVNLILGKSETKLKQSQDLQQIQKSQQQQQQQPQQPQQKIQQQQKQVEQKEQQQIRRSETTTASEKPNLTQDGAKSQIYQSNQIAGKSTFSKQPGLDQFSDIQEDDEEDNYKFSSQTQSKMSPIKSNENQNQNQIKGTGLPSEIAASEIIGAQTISNQFKAFQPLESKNQNQIISANQISNNQAFDNKGLGLKGTQSAVLSNNLMFSKSQSNQQSQNISQGQRLTFQNQPIGIKTLSTNQFGASNNGITKNIKTDIPKSNDQILIGQTSEQSKLLQEENQMLKQQIQIYVDQLEDLQIKNKQLQSKNQDLENKKGSNQSEISIFNENNQLKKKLDNFELENNQLNRKVLQLVQETERLKNQLSQTYTNQFGSHNELQQLKDTLNQLQQENQNLHMQIDKLTYEKNTLTEYKIEATKLLQNMGGNGININENQLLKKRIEILQQEIKYLSEQITKYKNQIITENNNAYTEKYPKLSTPSKQKNYDNNEKQKFVMGAKKFEQQQLPENDMESYLENEESELESEDVKDGVPLSEYFNKTKGYQNQQIKEQKFKTQNVKYNSLKIGEYFEDPVEEQYLIQNKLGESPDVEVNLDEELVYPFHNVAEYYTKNTLKVHSKLQINVIQYQPELFQMILRIYQHQVDLDRFKYSCLTQKASTFENNEIQIGSKSELFLDDHSSTFQCEVGLYFGNKSTIPYEQFRIDYEYDNNIRIEIDPITFYGELGIRKQLKQQIICTLLNTPFKPIIGTASYTVDNTMESIKFVMPLLINKFMAFREFQIEEFKDIIKDKSRKTLNSDYFQLNPLYFKSSKDLQKYFPDLIDLNITSNSGGQSSPEQVFSGIFTLDDDREEFGIKLQLKHRTVCQISVISLSFRIQQAEFIIQTLTFLLKK